MYLIQSGKLDVALEYSGAYCSSNPEDPDAWFIRAGIHSARGEIREVISCCQRVLNLQPENSGAHYNLGVVALNQENAGKALGHFSKALEINPEHMLAAHAKGQVEQALNE